MDFPKLLSLLESAHSAYAITVAESSRQYREWIENAVNGRDAELLYAEVRNQQARDAAQDAFNTAYPESGAWALADEEAATVRLIGARNDADRELMERRGLIAVRHTETTRYARQWYDAAIKGAAQDFNLALIRAMDEAGKP